MKGRETVLVISAFVNRRFSNWQANMGLLSEITKRASNHIRFGLTWARNILSLRTSSISRVGPTLDLTLSKGSAKRQWVHVKFYVLCRSLVFLWTFFRPIDWFELTCLPPWSPLPLFSWKGLEKVGHLPNKATETEWFRAKVVWLGPDSGSHNPLFFWVLLHIMTQGRDSRHEKILGN